MSIYDSLLTLDKERKGVVDEHSTKISDQIGSSLDVVDNLTQLLDSFELLEHRILTSYSQRISTPILKEVLAGTEQLEAARVIIDTVGTTLAKKEYIGLTGITPNSEKRVEYIQSKLDTLYRKQK